MPLQAVATFVMGDIVMGLPFYVSMPLQAVATFVVYAQKKGTTPQGLNAFAGSSYFCYCIKSFLYSLDGLNAFAGSSYFC